MHNITKYKKEKTNLIRNINKLTKERTNTLKRIKKLNTLYRNNKISSNKYESYVNKLLNNKQFTYWINHNSRQIDYLQKKLYLVNAKLKGSNTVYIEKNIILMLILLLFSLTYFTLDLEITGLSVLDSAVIFESDNSINIDKNISSLRLSGILEGNGSGKVYLDNYLVLDTSLLNISHSQTTSQNNEDSTNKSSDIFTIQPVNTDNKKEFNEICIETCENITSIDSTLKVDLEGSLKLTITSFNYTLNQEKLINLIIENITLPEENIPLIQNLTLENLTIKDKNQTNLTQINLTSSSDLLIQLKAEINKPVEWKLITKNKSIELPLESINIKVEKIVNETTEEKEPAKLKNLFSTSSLQNSKKIEVDELNETKLEVTYYTKAPYSLETNFSEKFDQNKLTKEVTIKSDSELHYQNVLSYTNLDPEIQNKEQLKLYYYVYNNQTNTTEKTDITTNQLYNVSYLDLNNNGLIDKLVWYVPQLSEQNFSVEISLTILTLQSYPVVNSNWTVLFNTTGTADLKIRASNGTTWSNDLNSTGTDLTFLELKCGTAIQNYQWLNNSVLISNYQCNETSQEISKVLTIGVHTIEFTFGNITKHAYNLASVTNGTAGDLNNSNAVFFNTTFNSSGFVQLNGSGSSGYPNFSLFGNYTSKIFNANASAKWSNFSWGELVPFGQELPGNGFSSIIETSSASRGFNMTGNVLLMHFDNITNFENATNGSKFNVYDWSLNRNNGTGIAN